MYFKTCPLCGAHLDPGEHCQCDKEQHYEPDIEEAYTSTRSLSNITRDQFCAPDAVQRYRRYMYE